MAFRDDTRGQAIQIGAVLLFGILIISFATYQAFVVPNQNKKVEFSHNKEVQTQLQDLRNAIVSATGTNNARSVTVSLGTEYPSRVVALNPSTPMGTLRTEATTDPAINVTLDNVQSTGETRDFWNGSTRSVLTGGIVYQPGYREYTSAPTTAYENTVLYNVFRNQTLSVTGQRLISGSRLTIVTVNGTLSKTQPGSVSVDLQPVSASTRQIPIEAESASDPINLTLPTKLDKSQWDQLLDGEFTDQGGHVEALTPEALANSEYDLVHIELETGVTYRLEMSRVSLGTNVGDPGAAYVTDVKGDGANVPEGTNRTVTVEVRDRFNNPVHGVLVRTNTTRDDSSLASTQDRTDEDGRIKMTYRPPKNIDGNPKSDAVEASYQVDPATSSVDGGTPENATVDLTIENTDGSGTGSGGGSSAYTVSWIQPDGQLSCSGGVCTLDGGVSRTVDVTMETSPTAIGSDVGYSVNNSTVGSLNPSTGVTNTTGQNETTFEARNEGGINLYTASGGSGDKITLNVTNLVFETVAFLDNDDDALKTIASDGTVETHVPNSEEEIRAIGPIEDVSGNGNDDIPYVNNGRDLRLYDVVTDSKQTIVSSDVRYSSSTIGVGDATGDGNAELYYRSDSDNGYLYRAFLNGTTERVETRRGGGCTGRSDPIADTSGVIDVTDYDDDQNQDVIYVTGNQNVGYFETESCDETIVNVPDDIAVNNAPGAGEVFDFNGSPVLPIVDGNSNVSLVNADGTITTLTASYEDTASAPLAPADWDGDGDVDIVHLNNNDNNNLYYLGVFDDQLTRITNDNGNPESARGEGGAR